jgi:hypothetical protein
MIPRAPKIQNIKVKTKSNGRFVLDPKVQSALDTIWAENQGGFPRLEGTKTRGHALRQQIRHRFGLSKVTKPDIQEAMRANAQYQEWQSWVFDIRERPT